MYYIPMNIFVCYTSGDSVFYKEPIRPSTEEKELRYNWKDENARFDNMYHHFCEEGIHVVKDYSDELSQYYDAPELILDCWREAYTFLPDGSVEIEYAPFADGPDYFQKLFGSAVPASLNLPTRAEREVGTRTGRFIYCDVSCVIVDYDYNSDLTYGIDGTMPQDCFLRVVYTAKEANEAVLKAERKLDGPLVTDVVPFAGIRTEDFAQFPLSADEFTAALLGRAFVVGSVYQCYESEGADHYLFEYDHLAAISWLHSSIQNILLFGKDSVEWYYAPGLYLNGKINWNYDSTRSEITLGWPFSVGRLQPLTDFHAQVRYLSDKYMILDTELTVPSAEGAEFSRIVMKSVNIDDNKVNMEN
ncbi:MAG: hypothetical protein J6T94_04670 [Bacteroidaceae bacterium]|nr:hypothetical protein [Bacteroidaceae bacterium]